MNTGQMKVLILNSKKSDMDVFNPRYLIQLLSNATQLRADISCNLEKTMIDVSAGMNREHHYTYWKVRMLKIYFV